MNVVIKFPLERVRRSTSGNLGTKKTAEVIAFGEIEQTTCRNAADNVQLRKKILSKNKI